MQDSTTTMPDGDWRFDFGDPKPPEIKNPEILPYLGEPDRWTQYTDDMTYEMDCLVRKWIEESSKSPTWKNSYKNRRYTMSMVIEQIYGRPYDQAEDQKRVLKLSRILAYYSTRVQNGGSIKGKMYSKTIYTISPSRFRKAPYSLRLRLEWLAERGEVPTHRNMALPKDDLKPGHARNPRTERNMEKRREQAKQRYRDRKH